MPKIQDPIVALATPQGSSAIALIRVSGPALGRLAAALVGGQEPRARVARHVDYRSVDGRVLDDVLLLYFKGPRSYTGEDVLEISCHGNPFIAQLIVEDLFNRGCRPAEPGEFTQRAFLGGRMDLSQAEAVMDIIHARSERALEAARQQLRGSLGRRMAVLVDDLLGALARVEAYIDFPDEDLPKEDRRLVEQLLERCRQGAGQLLATSHYGEILREGIRTVIIGEPNAGKSSLLNRLVGRERAIVSPEPGTTRDFIEECILVGAHFLRLIDTAGLNPNPQPLERLGMEKTLERSEEADLFLIVLDPGHPCPVLPPALLARLTPGNCLVLINKADLGLPEPELDSVLAPLPRLALSALNGEGVEALRARISELADGFQQQVGSELVAINARHARALGRVRESLEAGLAKLAEGGPVELLASDLREALDACGEISGRIDNERMLDALFSTFCIGK